MYIFILFYFIFKEINSLKAKSNTSFIQFGVLFSQFSIELGANCMHFAAIFIALAEIAAFAVAAARYRCCVCVFQRHTPCTKKRRTEVWL